MDGDLGDEEDGQGPPLAHAVEVDAPVAAPPAPMIGGDTVEEVANTESAPAPVATAETAVVEKKDNAAPVPAPPAKPSAFDALMRRPTKAAAVVEAPTAQDGAEVEEKDTKKKSRLKRGASKASETSVPPAETPAAPVIAVGDEPSSAPAPEPSPGRPKRARRSTGSPDKKAHVVETEPDAPVVLRTTPAKPETILVPESPPIVAQQLPRPNVRATGAMTVRIALSDEDALRFPSATAPPKATEKAGPVKFLHPFFAPRPKAAPTATAASASSANEDSNGPVILDGPPPGKNSFFMTPAEKRQLKEQQLKDKFKADLEASRERDRQANAGKALHPFLQPRDFSYERTTPVVSGLNVESLPPTPWPRVQHIQQLPVYAYATGALPTLKPSEDGSYRAPAVSGQPLGDLIWARHDVDKAVKPPILLRTSSGAINTSPLSPEQVAQLSPLVLNGALAAHATTIAKQHGLPLDAVQRICWAYLVRAAGVDAAGTAGASLNATWPEKYKAASSSEVVGNVAAVGALRTWLNHWKDVKKTSAKKRKRHDDSDSNDDGLVRVAVLLGPHGAGKTAAVYACAAELGCEVLEVSTSDRRSGKVLTAMFGEATQSHHVSKYKAAAGQAEGPTGDKDDPVVLATAGRRRRAGKETKPAKKAKKKSSKKRNETESESASPVRAPKRSKRGTKAAESSEGEESAPRQARNGKRRRAPSDEEPPAPADDDDDFLPSPEPASKRARRGAAGNASESRSSRRSATDKVESPPSNGAGSRAMTPEPADPPMATAVRRSPLRALRGATSQESSPAKPSIPAAGANASAAIVVPDSLPMPPPSAPVETALILLEDVDVLFDDDKGFWGAVSALAETAKRPIVMTCAELPMAATEMSNMVLDFERPPVDVLSLHLCCIALCEGLNVAREDAVALLRQCDCDLRQALTLLQFWHQTATPITSAIRMAAGKLSLPKEIALKPCRPARTPGAALHELATGSRSLMRDADEYATVLLEHAVIPTLTGLVGALAARAGLQFATHEHIWTTETLSVQLMVPHFPALEYKARRGRGPFGTMLPGDDPEASNAAQLVAAAKEGDDVDADAAGADAGDHEPTPPGGGGGGGGGRVVDDDDDAAAPVVHRGGRRRVVVDDDEMGDEEDRMEAKEAEPEERTEAPAPTLVALVPTRTAPHADEPMPDAPAEPAEPAPTPMDETVAAATMGDEESLAVEATTGAPVDGEATMSAPTEGGRKRMTLATISAPRFVPMVERVTVTRRTVRTRQGNDAAACRAGMDAMQALMQAADSMSSACLIATDGEREQDPDSEPPFGAVALGSHVATLTRVLALRAAAAGMGVTSTLETATVAAPDEDATQRNVEWEGMCMATTLAPHVTYLRKRALLVDYLPSMRAIARCEQSRKDNILQRRFLHHFSGTAVSDEDVVLLSRPLLYQDSTPTS